MPLWLADNKLCLHAPREDILLPTDTKYSKQQLNAMMERYTLELLRPHAFANMPVEFKFANARAPTERETQ